MCKARRGLAGTLTWGQDTHRLLLLPLPSLSLLRVWGAHGAPFMGLLVLITASGRSTLLPTLPCLWLGPHGRI